MVSWPLQRLIYLLVEAAQHLHRPDEWSASMNIAGEHDLPAEMQVL